MESFSEFVKRHENDDTAGLLLSGKFPDNVDPGLAANTIEVRRKLKRKAPSWYGMPELVYPVKISGEQCSSEATAMYKAATAERLFLEDRLSCGDVEPESRKPGIADLTGGLGIDSWAFSKTACKVMYNEMNHALADAAAKNFRTLGCTNITVCSFRIVPSLCRGTDIQEGKTGDIPSVTPSELLADFCPDIIFLDPARRGGDGSKVFLLEHCSPDVLSLKDELAGLSRYIMLKLSPMADMEMLLNRLGTSVRELHILASEGETKEVLAVMDREFGGECTVVAANYTGNIRETVHASSVDAAFGGWSEMKFRRSELKGPEDLSARAERLSPGEILYEPGKALMKAGAFRILSRRFPLKKLGTFTHYFILDTREPIKDGTVGELEKFGKFFVIREVKPLDRRAIRETGKKYPEAEVTARNIKMDTDTLRKKLGVSSGGNVHIFGLRCDFPSGQENILAVCEKCQNLLDPSKQ